MRKWREPRRQHKQKQAQRNLLLLPNSWFRIFRATPIRGLGISKVSFSFLFSPHCARHSRPDGANPAESGTATAGRTQVLPKKCHHADRGFTLIRHTGRLGPAYSLRNSGQYLAMIQNWVRTISSEATKVRFTNRLERFQALATACRSTGLLRPDRVLCSVPRREGSWCRTCVATVSRVSLSRNCLPGLPDGCPVVDGSTQYGRS